MATIKTWKGRERRKVVSRKAWLKERMKLLEAEKKLTRRKDAVARRRRALPWVKVGRRYLFDGPRGRVSLADIFRGRSQLIVYHFMFAPGEKEPCRSCAFWTDHWDAAIPHLQRRDTTLAVISRAPLRELNAFRRRMGWKFDWYSCGDSGFNHDFGVSFSPEELRAGPVTYNYRRRRFDDDLNDLPGISAFYREGRSVYHTYSAFSRGIDGLNGTYNLLDITAKGRDEDPERPMRWVRYHAG
ncbi:MAG TPA: DUF899 domain-containing protein [Opitutaceae bacterium]|jgi:predicted dithiol-disulfide oxidoreductase (DUF899 family)